jgi:hypothetical protein
MASAKYPLGIDAIATGAINLGTATIKVALVTSAYTYSSAHQFYSSVNSFVVGTPVAISGQTVSGGGILTVSGPVTFTAVSGSATSALVVFVDTGTPSTSRLIEFIDGVATVPNGLNIQVTFTSNTVMTL